MGYEIAKFGDAGYTSGVSNVKQQVSNQYGPRDIGGTTGVIKTEGAMNELTLHMDDETLQEQNFVLTVKPLLPAFCRIEDVYLEVETAFTLTGTTPGVAVGTEGSEAANGVAITEAQLETPGMYDLTGALVGTWAADGGLTVDTTVGVALTGTAPTIAGGGIAKLVIRYVKV